MNWKLPLFAGLTALVGLTGALPAYGDGAETGLVAMSGNLAENATLAEGNAGLSERDPPPLDWGSECPWWPTRSPGSILGNEGNKFNLKSDCSRKVRPYGDLYTIHTDISPELHDKACACQYLHYFLRMKLLSIVDWQRPICVPWNNDKGVEIKLEAYTNRVGDVNKALEQLYGFKSTCRVGWPKSASDF